MIEFSTKNTLEIVKIAVSSSAKATINSVSGESVQLNKYFWMLRIAMFISRVKNNYSNKLELILQMQTKFILKKVTEKDANSDSFLL